MSCLVLKNNKTGKPFGDSDVNININRYESLDNIRNMFGLGNNIVSNNNNQLKGASIPNNIPICDKTKSFIKLKHMFGLI